MAAACVKNGFTVKNVKVSMPGGELDIEIREDWTIKMRGQSKRSCPARSAATFSTG
ncbi:MAG: hypothetical protein R3B51_06060 [Thermodesulfobacteriota bacterium]